MENDMASGWDYGSNIVSKALAVFGIALVVVAIAAVVATGGFWLGLW
jgi:hypothetical protein